MQDNKNIKKLTGIAKKVRQNAILSIIKAGSGHPAGVLGSMDIFVALYFGGVLNIDPSRPNMRDRDYVILSEGHVCPAWYSVLAEAGYFPIRELWTLRKLGSKLQGHPVYKSLPGIENTSGPLGHGVSVATGLAYALRNFKKTNQDVYCISSDGEHNEGQTWEAIMFAGKNALPNLTMIIDKNNIQSDGKTKDVMPLEPLAEKYSSFGWHVLEIDGNNISEIVDAILKAKEKREKPVCIIAETVPGKGVKFMEGDYNWHAKPLSGEEAKQALKCLGSKSAI